VYLFPDLLLCVSFFLLPSGVIKNDTEDSKAIPCGVNDLPKAKVATGIQTYDLPVASPTPYRYATACCGNIYTDIIN